MSEPARQVLEELIGRYAYVANSARRVSTPVLPSLPGDDELDDTLVVADADEAKTWYLDNAQAVLDALVLAEKQGADKHTSRVVRGLERVLTGTHDVGSRLVLAELALTSARRAGDKPAEAQLLANRGGCHKMAGRQVEAIEDYKQALRLFTDLDDMPGALVTLNRLAVAHTAARQLSEADAALDQVLTHPDSSDLLRALAYINRAWVANQRGETEAPIEHARVGLKMLEDIDADKGWFPEAYLQLAEAYTRDGDFDRARSHLNTAWTLLANGAKTVPLEISTTHAEGELLLAQGHHRDALARFQHALFLQAIAPDPFRRPDTVDGVGKALAALGKFELAAGQHVLALVERERVGERFATARTRYLLAKAKAAAGQSGEAVKLREQALLELAGIDDPAAATLRIELAGLAV